MGLNFQFATASQIIFGNDAVQKVPELLADIGIRVLLVAGKDDSRARSLISVLPKDIEITMFQVATEPTIQLVDEGVNAARGANCDVIIGFGGGSVIDSAKAIAALVPNKGELLDYLEVIGKGKKLTQNPLPCIAIPTTAGTGAEVTKNSVIKSPEHHVKVSLRSNLMYPDFAVVDPQLTLSMPPEITASTGVDALTHLLETFVSNQSNPFINMFCKEGMKRISRSLLKACKNGNDLNSRENMAMASMFGGMALANVKLGAVHGFAGPMGGMFPVAHGAVCACLLPAVMEINQNALSKLNRKDEIVKYFEVAKVLTGNPNATADDGITWVKQLVSELQIPRLSQFGLSKNDFPELVQKAKKASSMKGNPVVLDDNELTQILEKSC